MRSLISHLRYTIRLLLKSPGFTITAVLILGLGIGANTAIFSLVNGVLLKPLPYPSSDRLVQIFQPFKNHNTSRLDYPDFRDYNAGQHTFAGLTAYSEDDFNLSGQGEPERLPGLWVSGTFFKILGRPSLLGRLLGEADDRADARSVVVLSEHLWRSKFNSDPRIVGTSILLNSELFQVVGIAPGLADEGGRVDLYVPLSRNPDTEMRERRGFHYFSCVGRLKEGVTLQQAQSDLKLLSQNLNSKYPATSGFGIRLVPYLDSVTGDYSTMLWVLEGTVLCMLLITCANVANLLLARAQERRREINVRAALGASRTRLVSQLLTESLVLSGIGGVIGLLLASWTVAAMRMLVPQDVPRFEEFRLDGTSFVFVLAATVFSTLAAGLLPAWTISRADVASALKAEGDRAGTAGRRRRRSQTVLVIAQVALSCLLLVGAGLLSRSFVALQTAPLGFRTDHTLTAHLYLADAKYSTQSASKLFFDTLLGKLRQLPGVVSVGSDDDLPFTGPETLSFGIAGQPEPEPWKLPTWQPQVVSADFFKTVGIPLLRGRLFEERERVQKEVIVNESLAKTIFPGQEALGKQLHDYNSMRRKENVYTIVGIVPKIRHDSPGVERTPYQAYFLYSQDPFAPWPANSCTLVIRTEGDPFSLASALKQSVTAIDPNIPLSQVDSFDRIVQNTFVPQRLAVTVVALFSITALLLAAIGLYGVLAYSVGQRQREIGVRIALGAGPSTVLRLVISQGLKIVLAGLVIGLLAAVMLAHLMDSMLYGVSATDPLSIALSAIVLTAAGGVACLLPAMRAIRIDPIQALRE
jgi:predicted permease